MPRNIYSKALMFTVLLVAVTRTLAQEPVTGDLQRKFTDYTMHSLQEKIFVHTDKNFYLAGETIWFKLYTVDETFNKPLAISKLAYIEVVSEEQKAVMQAKIQLQDGLGNGSLIIPSSLPSGNYRLRSYTSRMKNFSPEFYFHQTITIANTLKAPTVKIKPPVQYRIDFFPEGGNLVNGIEATVAFKVTDQYGHGIDAAGYVLGAKKDTILQLQTLHAGMGSFSFLPQKENPCQAVFRIADTTIVQNLPPVYEQGYAMHLREDGAAGVLELRVNASLQFNNLPVYLFVHSRQLVKEVLTGTLTDGKFTFRLDKNRLGEGISHFTVFNAARQPVCERLYCKRPANQLLIQARTDRPGYGNRKKINIQLQTGSQSNIPINAEMSVAVFMTDSLQAPEYQDIQSWLLLQSELMGRIESARYYFADSSATATAALDNLMLTQGWRRFKWENVSSGQAPVFEFVTESEGPVINGMVNDKNTGLPKKDILTTLTVPGQHFEFRTTMSKQDGSFRFNVNGFYSGNDVIVQPANAADSNLKVSIASPFSDKFSVAPFPLFAIPAKWNDQLLGRSINAQAYNAYQAEAKMFSFNNAPTDTTAFYGKPEKAYYLDDYTRFITMEEVMQELVLDVRIRKQPEGYQFRVVNNAFKEFFEQAPLVLIDGVQVNDPGKIMALDPLKIRKIEVATHKHFLGPLVSEGIVSYTSYQGDLGGYELDPQAVVIEYEGLQRQRIFYSPVYETDVQQQSRLPDTRNVLFWAPSVKTNADGKQQLSFYTSDIKGNFVVVVQGLTPEGISGSSITNFVVEALP